MKVDFVLLLLHSPAVSLGYTVLGEIFTYVTVFFNPTIEVVTFHLRGWCMLGVFWAFTRLGHECQDFFSLCNGVHVCIDKTSVYTIMKECLGNGSQNPMLTPREKSPLPEKKSPQRRNEPTTLHQAGQRA